MKWFIIICYSGNEPECGLYNSKEQAVKDSIYPEEEIEYVIEVQDFIEWQKKTKWTKKEK